MMISTDQADERQLAALKGAYLALSPPARRAFCAWIRETAVVALGRGHTSVLAKVADTELLEALTQMGEITALTAAAYTGYRELDVAARLEEMAARGVLQKSTDKGSPRYRLQSQ